MPNVAGFPERFELKLGDVTIALLQPHEAGLLLHLASNNPVSQTRDVVVRSGEPVHKDIERTSAGALVRTTQAWSVNFDLVFTHSADRWIEEQP